MGVASNLGLIAKVYLRPTLCFKLFGPEISTKQYQTVPVAILSPDISELELLKWFWYLEFHLFLAHSKNIEKH